MHSMDQQNWLPLIEYSNKHQISISTLRRRIKDNSISFKLEDGKYFIVDDSVEKATRGRKPISMPNYSAENSDVGFSGDLQRGNVIDELKKAYLTALQSKEEQIFQLKEEVSDLKTLVKVLESENDRLKNELDRTNLNSFTNGRQI
jgi:hypothetical protein